MWDTGSPGPYPCSDMGRRSLARGRRSSVVRPGPDGTASPELEPGRRIELLTYALREGPGPCLVGSGDDSTLLTWSYQIGCRVVPVRGAQIYGMNMGWTVRREAMGGGHDRPPRVRRRA